MVTPGKLARRAALFEQLGTLLAAGVSLTQAMEMASRNRATGVPQKVLQELTHHLKEGHTFSDAMQFVSGQKRDPSVASRRSHDYALSDFDIALLSTGEESGRLDVTFKTLARYYAARAKIIRDTLAGLLTTMATLHVFLLIFPLRLMTACAMGVMNSDYAQCVPYLINKIILFGGLYGAIFLFLYAGQANRAESWRAAVESVFNLVPVLRKAVRCLALARLACALEALTNAGVPVIRSWELAAAACGSPLLKQALLRWTPRLETGTTPAEMISQISYFPEIFNNLYHSGEISGKLDETLSRLHNYMEEEGFRALQMFTRILNGTIYGLVVLLVAYNIIGFYLDRFKAINAGLNF